MYHPDVIAERGSNTWIQDPTPDADPATSEALLVFGSGPVRGFAVVHCLGILTSMFSAVVVSRTLVNLFYGSRRRLERIAIGNTSWK